jgi:hypothetical protein
MSDQPVLFSNEKGNSKPKPRSTKGLEVHQHIFITGKRANGLFNPATQKTTAHFSHSHEGGDIPHTHPHTGPASYTIDKDEWFRSTGLRGGGRKKFTPKPAGEQMLFTERTVEENSFEIIVGPPPKDQQGEGPGMALPMRMILGFGMTVSDIRGDDGEAA